MIADRLRGAAIAAGLVARGLAIRRRRTTLPQRLAMLPATLPASGPVTIHWDAHQIPFIEAASDSDLAVALGVVHAHLRLGQMEIMRRLAQGRVAEMVGPLGVELDRTLLQIDFGRAAPAIAASLRPDVRAWAEGFVRGVNHVLLHAPRLPEEMRLLGIGREPWTLEHLLANTRLAAADVNWIVYGRLLKARAALPEAEWREVWPRLFASGVANPDIPMARSGSNAAAVAGRRSASGGALLAADPHLSVALPNVWLAAGMRSPGLNCVGLMPAGFPIMAIGRNPHLAWGGTSLHAAATDLFDASNLPLTERTVTLRVRGARPQRIVLQESPLGPVVSDGLMFRNPTRLAMRWVGHEPSDEVGAMLDVMRADSSEAFARALAGFALPGQNMVHAAADGRVGHLLALRTPRHDSLPGDLVLPPGAASAWDGLAGGAEFPNRLDPPEGFVASANDAQPWAGSVPAGFFFSPPDRVRRMRALFGGNAPLDLEDLAAAQLDVAAQRATVAALLERIGDSPHPARAVLAAWDGQYDEASRGAVAYEAVMAELARRLPGQERIKPVAAIWMGRTLLAGTILALPDSQLQPMLTAALDRAQRLLRRHRRWGRLHRMRLAHHLAAVPVLGRRYSFGSYGSPGGNDTLNKTGHAPVRGRHNVTFGASARFLADMAEPDANRVALLGGQDGWLGSSTFLDQVPAWRAGAYVTLPLRAETARRWPHHTVLTPA